jgi:drug/metabolite transporter (DMT)-like permease
MSLFILTRVLLSVSGNTLQKRLLLDGTRVLPLWLVTYSLMLVPALVLAVARPMAAPAEFWGNVLLGGFLDAVGNLAMVAALRTTDLSIFGPLNAFRPILALLFGWIFLSETPTAMGAAGVAIIVTGALVLFSGSETAQFGARLRTFAFRLLGLSLSTIGAVFLKRAALAGCAELTLGAWTACGLVCLLVFAAGRGDQPWSLVTTSLGKHGSWLLPHAATFFAMQWFTIRIFQHTLLAYSFAYFQLAMVLQLLLAGFIFRERNLPRRLVGCAIMCLGSGLLLWKG